MNQELNLIKAHEAFLKALEELGNTLVEGRNQLAKIIEQHNVALRELNDELEAFGQHIEEQRATGN